jgi:hypothetical protein
MAGNVVRVASLLGVVACGSSNTPQDAAVDAQIRRTVSGTVAIDLISAAGTSTLLADLTRFPPMALTSPAFVPIPGSGTANGTFSIPGVPEGTYYLQGGDTYLVLSDDTVDLSFDVLANQSRGAATGNTNLTFNVTGLAPWQTTDELALFSPQTGTAAYAMEAVATAGVPAANDTSLTGFVYNLLNADDRALIDTTSGDQAFFTQLATQTDGTRSYRTIARSYSPSMKLVNGGASTLTGAFDTSTATATLDAVWDRPAFAAELAAHFPTAAPDNWSTFAVTALPDAAARGHYGDGPDIVVFAPGYLTDSTAVTANWSYADPYPADWTRIVFVRYYRYRYIHAAGTDVALFAEMRVHRDLATATSQSPIVPLVGVPLNPKINGMDASGPVIANLGMTPTISWDPPTLGTASRYYVDVQEIEVQASDYTLRTVASIATSDTQVMIPSNVLVPGRTYVFQIGALSLTGVDLRATPDRLSLPEGWASITTTAATP